MVNKRLRLILLSIVVILTLLIAVFAFVLFSGKLDFLMDGNAKTKSHKESTVDKDKDSEESDDKAQGKDSEAKKTESDYEKASSDEASDEEEKYMLLEAVSIDLTPFLRTPEDEESVVALLEVGQRLRWYGEVRETEDETYYKVLFENEDIEGYVSKKDVVRIYYDAPFHESIIEDDTTLYTYDMMEKDIRELEERFGEHLLVSELGMSYDGRTVYCLRLGNPNASKRIMVTAAIHGREYMTTQLTMKMVEYYLINYDNGEYNGVKYSDIFDKVAFDIIPMSNPDGITIAQLGVDAIRSDELKQRIYECYERDKYLLEYEIDQNGDGLWIDHWKEGGFNVFFSDNPTMISFNEYVALWKANAWGVDLNCNFDADWQNVESRLDAAYSNYKGPSVMSEVETTLLYSQALQFDYECFINYHSRGNLIYYSCMGASDEVCDESEKLAKMVSEFNKYRPFNQNKTSSVTLGGFGDFVMLKLNKPSIGIECGKRPCPLALDELMSMYIRNKEVWAMLATDYVG